MSERAPLVFNLADFCLEPGQDDAEALVFVDAERIVARRTRGELRARVTEQARALAARAPKGARVGLRMTNTPAMAEAFFACAKAGLIAVPLSPQLTREETEALLADAEASLVLVERPAELPPFGLGPPVVAVDALTGTAPLPATGDEDPVLLIYTSGTGGRPKGVLHAHRSVRGRVPMRAGWLGIEAGDRVLHAGTLNWTYTLGVGLMDPLSVGAAAVLFGGKAEPHVWAEVIERFDIAVFAAVPTVYRRLLKYGEPARIARSALKHGVCAGEPLPAELWRAWQEATGRPLFEALGMTEISTYISSGPATPTRPGTPGRPQPGRRIAVLDPESRAPLEAPGATGLLAVHLSDPGLMLGYWRQPEADAEVFAGEWFAGGDLVHLDDEGYVHFHGRADDLMNALGVRTSPVEIERVLVQHEAVQDAAVTSLPNAEGVELITAFVVPADGHGVDADDLRAFAAEHLAAYKLPKRIVETRDLPRTANGKVQRKRLATLLASS